MVKKKPSINQNFEALKAQMQAKRKLAENKFEKEKEEKSTSITTLVPPTNIEAPSSNIEEEEYITINIVDDDDFNELDVTKDNEDKTTEDITQLSPKSELSSELSDEEVSTSDLNESLEGSIQDNTADNVNVAEKEEIVQSITPRSKKSETADINMNKIIIKRVEKQEAPKRITYYLKPETIKKIDKFSKATGMGKSEFVQTILDEILNNLEVEK